MLPSDSQIFASNSGPSAEDSKPAPQRLRRIEQSKSQALADQSTDNPMLDITSSQLAELDAEVVFEDADPTMQPSVLEPLVSANDSFRRSQLDLTPDQAADLEAKAVATPIAKPASPRKTRGLKRTHTVVSDISELEISSQELRELPL